MIKNNFAKVHLQIFCESPCVNLFEKDFFTLAQALKFVNKHKSSTYGCYRYVLEFSDSVSYHSFVDFSD